MQKKQPIKLLIICLFVAPLMPIAARAEKPVSSGKSLSATSTPARNVKVIYGAMADETGSQFTMRVGNGQASDCALGLWQWPKADIISVEAVGTCFVRGTNAPPTTNYKVTYRSLIP